MGCLAGDLRPVNYTCYDGTKRRIANEIPVPGTECSKPGHEASDTRYAPVTIGRRAPDNWFEEQRLHHPCGNGCR